ncbi:MAG: pirin family protein [Acidimicrobiia bacterium]
MAEPVTDPTASATDPVIESVALGTQWPTIDPFLFCAHHDDAYPAGTDSLGPDAPLTGREIGSDFAGVDGWNMYHGAVVPGFPQHPHRGFETVTYVRRGFIDHADSLGAAARFGSGDVQWLTAGKGVVHSEMFPLLRPDAPNDLELFQIWLNLPAVDKMADPYFTMLWHDDIPQVRHVDDAGRVTSVTVVAGELDGKVPPPAPPNSWAARPEADVAIWVVRMDADAQWVLPPAHGPATVRTLYAYDGSGMRVGDHEICAGTGAVVHCDVPVSLTAGDGGVELLVLQGRPIGEPVEQYGPFVMNDREGIAQTFADYQRTGFGGWPWPVDDPVHGREPRRFARHADGRVEERAATGED